jgi:hypothetical protein
MSKKLKDLDISVRLFHVTKSMGIETITELKEWYKTCSLDNLPRNMGRKSFTEIEELISANKNGLGLYEQREIIKENRKLTNFKNLVKRLHKEVFYTDKLNDKLVTDIIIKLGKSPKFN